MADLWKLINAFFFFSLSLIILCFFDKKKTAEFLLEMFRFVSIVFRFVGTQLFWCRELYAKNYQGKNHQKCCAFIIKTYCLNGVREQNSLNMHMQVTHPSVLVRTKCARVCGNLILPLSRAHHPMTLTFIF